MQYFCGGESSLPHYQIFDIRKFENIVKLKICSLAHKLYNNLSTVSEIFNNLLTPVTSVHSYNTRNSTKLNFCRPKVRTNIGKFSFTYSVPVSWETAPLTLKHLQNSNQFKKLHRAHLISSQSNNNKFNN